MKNSILLFLMLTGYFLTGQDLTITSLTGNKSIFRYEMFQTNAIIENKGAQTVDISTAINFFFSSDDILDGSDVFIGTTITDPLAVGESRSETLSISSRVPAGLYYLIAVADGETQINESK